MLTSPRQFPPFLYTCFLLLGVCTMSSAARADAALASILGDGMVLQRGMRDPIWGSAAPGERVTVRFRGASRSTRAAADGRWRVDLPATPPGGPFPLTVEARNTLTLPRVYVGDVWLGSGQSNMTFTTAETPDVDSFLNQPPNESLRLCQVYGQGATHGWHEARPQTFLPFSAVLYHFGRLIQADQKVPVGLIQSAVSGSPIEPWISVEKMKELGLESVAPPYTGRAYPNLIRSLQPYAIKGVVWFQGESNGNDPTHYRRMFAGMVELWRKEWGQGDFPFLFVQIEGLGAPNNELDPLSWLREAQRQSLAIRNTGMAVITDLSDGGIHPRNKRPMAERLALIARAKVYGEPGLEYSGPALESVTRVGDTLALRFSHAEGLAARGGELRQLEIRPRIGEFRPAEARIDGDRILINVRTLEGPFAVRYGWRRFPNGNLFNSAGLPASPFIVENVGAAPR